MEEILRYLDNKMEPKEQADFEQKLERETSLQAQLEEELQTRTAIFASAYQDRKAKLLTRSIESRPTRSLNTRFVLYAAAAVVVILVAILAIQPFQNPPSSDELYAQYYESVPFSGTVRGTNEDPFAAAKQAYESDNFDQAAAQFALLLADTTFSLRPKAFYYQGLSWMEMEKWGQAVNALKQVEAGSLFGPAAQWHLALGYIQMDEIGLAKNSLQQLLDGPIQLYQEKARNLLEQLDQYP